MSDTLIDALGEREKQAVKKFVDKIQKLKSREIKEPKEFELLGEAICNDFKLVDHIKQTTKNVMAKQAKVEAPKSSKMANKSAEDMIADEGLLESTRLIDRLTLTETPIESQDEENPNYISLMTIHSSKVWNFQWCSLWSRRWACSIKIVSVPYLGSQKKGVFYTLR